MITIWLVYWIHEYGESPEITLFTNATEAEECYRAHLHTEYMCDIDQFTLESELKLEARL